MSEPLIKIDDCDKHLLTNFYIGSNGYVILKPSLKSLHRAILNPPKNMIVDHINRDKLDNRRLNLRLLDASGNQHNKKISKTNTSGFQGVKWDKSRNKWLAEYRLRGRTYHLGRYVSFEDACNAYNNKKPYFDSMGILRAML